MVCYIERDLWVLTEAFCRLSATKRGQGPIQPRDGPCPRVELPYTYLMAWFALHCPAILQLGEEPPEGVRFAHLRRFENSQCEQKYVAEHFDVDLKRLGPREVIRATCYRIEISVPNLFIIFELYYPASGTFFTPVDELGMALHDM